MITSPSVVAAIYDRRRSSGRPASPSFPNSIWERTCPRNSVAAFLPLTALALTACSSAVTPDKISQIKPAMTPAQVEAILGRPASIDQSETADQSLTGEVDHYPAPNGEGRVVFINHVVFQAQFVPGATK